MSNRRLTLALAALALPIVLGASFAPRAYIAAAIADPSRPAADTARDAERKPAAMLIFAEVKPNETVVDYIPGGGYFTRLLSGAVGPHGHVYADVPQAFLDFMASKGMAAPAPVSAEPGRGNVSEVVAGGGSLNVPVPADLVWTAQIYHDVHILAGAAATAALNRAVFAALKPGGRYVIADHAGPGGLDDAGMKALHRIDETLVKREVLAAGFMLDGESEALRNSADPHTANVFDPSIRGHTDQFVLRFRKPG